MPILFLICSGSEAYLSRFAGLISPFLSVLVDCIFYQGRYFWKDTRREFSFDQPSMILQLSTIESDNKPFFLRSYENVLSRFEVTCNGLLLLANKAKLWSSLRAKPCQVWRRFKCEYLFFRRDLELRVICNRHPSTCLICTCNLWFAHNRYIVNTVLYSCSSFLWWW
jgi:hypothetical protein